MKNKIKYFEYLKNLNRIERNLLKIMNITLNNTIRLYKSISK